MCYLLSGKLKPLPQFDGQFCTFKDDQIGSWMELKEHDSRSGQPIRGLWSPEEKSTQSAGRIESIEEEIKEEWVGLEAASRKLRLKNL